MIEEENRRLKFELNDAVYDAYILQEQIDDFVDGLRKRKRVKREKKKLR